MSTPWIVEAIDVFKDRQFCLVAGVTRMSPYQFCLDCLGEGFHGCIAVAITFT